jgi:hypothetical protein
VNFWPFSKPSSPEHTEPTDIKLPEGVVLALPDSANSQSSPVDPMAHQKNHAKTEVEPLEPDDGSEAELCLPEENTPEKTESNNQSFFAGIPDNFTQQEAKLDPPPDLLFKQSAELIDLSPPEDLIPEQTFFSVNSASAGDSVFLAESSYYSHADELSSNLLETECLLENGQNSSADLFLYAADNHLETSSLELFSPNPDKVPGEESFTGNSSLYELGDMFAEEPDRPFEEETLEAVTLIREELAPVESVVLPQPDSSGLSAVSGLLTEHDASFNHPWDDLSDNSAVKLPEEDPLEKNRFLSSVQEQDNLLDILMSPAYDETYLLPEEPIEYCSLVKEPENMEPVTPLPARDKPDDLVDTLETRSEASHTNQNQLDRGKGREDRELETPAEPHWYTEHAPDVKQVNAFHSQRIAHSEPVSPSGAAKSSDSNPPSFSIHMVQFIEEEILLTEARFVKKSINHLVDSYFNQSNPF